MDIKYPVLCPLLQQEIDAGTCFDIHMVVAGEAPEWTMPEEVLQIDDYRKRCLNCPYHRED